MLMCYCISAAVNITTPQLMLSSRSQPKYELMTAWRMPVVGAAICPADRPTSTGSGNWFIGVMLKLFLSYHIPADLQSETEIVFGCVRNKAERNRKINHFSYWQATREPTGHRYWLTTIHTHTYLDIQAGSKS